MNIEELNTALAQILSLIHIYGRGVVCGLLRGCDSRSGGAALAQVRAIRKTDIIRRLFFCADVVGGLPLFALAMPLVSCSREKRLFGI